MKWMVTFIAAAVATMAILAALFVIDARRWEEFAREHHCAESARRQEMTWQTQYVYDAKGYISGSYVIPVQDDRITYRCDGGQVVER